MLDSAWLVFKFLFSLALGAVALVLLLTPPNLAVDPSFIGIAALLLFFAALPWVDLTRRSRELGLVLFVIGLGMALFSGRTALGYATFPRTCGGRRSTLCEFENALFEIGGGWLAAVPGGLFAAVLLVVSIRMLMRTARSRRGYDFDG